MSATILDGKVVAAAVLSEVTDRVATLTGRGKPVGLATILVMTGVTTPEELASHTIQPDMVFDTIDELATALLDTGP